MEENSSSQENLSDEFKNLGKNLVDAMRSAWESPGLKELQGEIENGLSEFGSTFKNEFESIKESPTAQQIKSDVEDLQDRYKTGEVEAKVRGDLISALQSINDELTKISQKLSGEGSDGEAGDAPEKEEGGEHA